MSDHQTGRTTRQMLAAPVDSVYIWVNGSLDYPRALALNLGRDDLQIKPLSWLRQDNVHGRTLSVIIDHAARWNDETVKSMEYLEEPRILFYLDRPRAFLD